jgi:hypothetical protein
MNIVTKFVLATDEFVDTLLELIKELKAEKFSSIVDQVSLRNYMENYYNRKCFISEMNNMSNQWFVVYVDDKKEGDAKVTFRGKAPQSLTNRRAIRIGDFLILKKFTQPEILGRLYQKCLSISKYVYGIWINEYLGSPMVDFFEIKGFLRQPEDWKFDQIALWSACSIHMNGFEKEKDI